MLKWNFKKNDLPEEIQDQSEVDLVSYRCTLKSLQKQKVTGIS